LIKPIKEKRVAVGQILDWHSSERYTLDGQPLHSITKRVRIIEIMLPFAFVEILNTDEKFTAPLEQLRALPEMQAKIETSVSGSRTRGSFDYSSMGILLVLLLMLVFCLYHVCWTNEGRQARIENYKKQVTKRFSRPQGQVLLWRVTTGAASDKSNALARG
jgi:hypothetical protein